MAQVYTVKVLSGVVFVVSATGQTRALKEGDVVLKGETVVSGPRGRVELVADDAAPIELRGEQRLQIDDSLFAPSAPASESAAVASGTIERVIDTLAGGGDLTEELEAPAAGAGGGAGDDGNGFVRLLRIVEPVDPLAFDFETSLSDLPPDYPGRPALIEEPPIPEPPVSPPEPPAPPAPAPGPAPSPAPTPTPEPPPPAPTPVEPPAPAPTPAPVSLELPLEVEEESVPLGSGGVLGNNEADGLSHSKGGNLLTSVGGSLSSIQINGETHNIPAGGLKVYYDADRNPIAVVPADGNVAPPPGAAVEFEIDASGNYTVTVLGPVNNSTPGTSEELDPLNGDLVLIGTAGNGADLKAPVTIDVQDDVPEVKSGNLGKLTAELEEESVPKAGGGVIGNNETKADANKDGKPDEDPELSHTTGVQTMTGAVNWGADGFGKVTGVTFGGTTVSVGGGSATVYFNALGVAQTDEAGSAAKLVVNEDGTYTLTVTGAMTHSEQGEDWLPLTTVDLVGEDKDGDPVSVPLEARVQDDVPSLLEPKEPTAGIIPTFSLSYHEGEAGQNNSVGFYVKDRATGKPLVGAVLFDGVKDRVPVDGALIKDDVDDTPHKWISIVDGEGKEYKFRVTLAEDGKGYKVQLPEGVTPEEGVTPDQIGFFLLPDGGALDTKFDLTAVNFEQSGDAWAVKMGDVVLNSDASGTASRVYFSDSALNPGGQSYVQEKLSGSWTGNKGDLNWEDLPIGKYTSDKDYDDVNFTLKWDGVPLMVSDGETLLRDSEKKLVLDGEKNPIRSKNTDTDADLGETQLSSRFEVNYGADGPAANDPKTFVYDFKYTDGVVTKLQDTASQEKVRLISGGTGVVRGVIGTGADEKTVFTLSVDDNGVLTLTQERAVLHNSSNPHDITNLGEGVLSLTATVTATDGDGDKVTSSAEYPIGHQVNFLDSGPEANDDFVAVTAVADGKDVIATFNVFEGDAKTGVGKDIHEGMLDGAQAQVVWVRTGGDQSYAATDFLEGTETSVKAKGAFGELTIEKDGDASYKIDDIKAKALVDGETREDLFSYQMKDADGDTDVATVAVKVTGVNDRPEFVTGKDTTTLLWVDKNGDRQQGEGETSLYSKDSGDTLTLTVREGDLLTGAAEDSQGFLVADPDIGDKPKVYFAGSTPTVRVGDQNVSGGISSGGKPVQWSANADATEVYGKVADDAGVETAVVTVSIVPTDASGTGYKAAVTLGAPIDGDDSDPLSLGFTLIAKDLGGLEDKMALTIMVEPGAPAGDALASLQGDDATAPVAAGFVAADASVVTDGLATDDDVATEGDDGDASFGDLGADVIEINLAGLSEADTEPATDVSGSDSLLIQDVLSDTEGLDLSAALGDVDAAALPAEDGDGAGAVQPVEAQGNAPEQAPIADIALEADILTMTTTKHDPSIT